MGIDEKLQQLEATIDHVEKPSIDLDHSFEDVEIRMSGSKMMQFMQKSIESITTQLLSEFLEQAKENAEKSQDTLVEKMEQLQPKDEVKISNPQDLMPKEVKVSNLKDLKIPKPDINVAAPDLKGLEQGIVKALGADENWNRLHFNRSSSGLVISIVIDYDNRSLIYEFKRNNKGLIDDIIRSVKSV